VSLHPILLLNLLHPVLLLLRCHCLHSSWLVLPLLVDLLLSGPAVLPATLPSVHSSPPLPLL
jgi:hypothetical protein